MTRYDLEPFRATVADWCQRRGVLGEKENTHRHVPDAEWHASDELAAEIVHELAALMGIGYDDVWSVTIAGTERHDGEAPYTYLVQATDEDAAKDFALAWHRAAEQDDDVLVADCTAGMPEGNHHWNDLRGLTLDQAARAPHTDTVPDGIVRA